MVEEKLTPANLSPDAGTAEEFSLEDLDKVLAESDPDFQKNLDSMKSDLVEGAHEVVELNITDEEDAEKEEAIDPNDLPIHKRTIFKIKHYLRNRFKKINDFLTPKIRAIKNLSILWAQQAYQFIRYELPERIQYLKAQLKVVKSKVVEVIQVFRSWSIAKKVASILILSASISSLYFVSRVFVPKWLPMFSIQLLQSWADEGEVLGVVNDRQELMSFFEAFPEIEFQIRLTKVVVNLRRDERSGKNPMGLFEFFLGLDSRDTAIEVRDREKEIIDLVQRTLEGFTYHEATSYNGKIRIKAAIKDNINQILNQGAVQRIYINRIVTYN